jgi:PKD repeat protein
MGGSIVLYEWDFDGDGIIDSTGEVVAHIYSSAGNYTVTLNVTDSEGLWDIEQKQIEVKAPPPVGGISTPVNKLELLAPYIGLTILLAVAVTTVVFLKHEKKP